MNNSGARWHNCEVIKSLGSPFEEGEPFFVPLELKLLIFSLCLCDSRMINLDRVVDDEVNGAERVDARWISA